MVFEFQIDRFVIRTGNDWESGLCAQPVTIRGRQ
jgi:hypothetical protein